MRSIMDSLASVYDIFSTGDQILIVTTRLGHDCESSLCKLHLI